MDFNPDEYLAKQDNGFDPDAYLSKNTEDRPLSALAEGVAQGGSLGYADEIRAATEPGVFKLLSKITGEDVKSEGDYISRRDEYVKKSKGLEESNPNMYLGGQLGGGIITALASAPLTAVKGAALTQRLASAAKIGAGMGALQDTETKKGELSFGALERLKNTAMGAGLGALFQGGFEGISKIAKAAPQQFAKYVSNPSKENVDDLVNAAKALDTEATPGMKSSSEVVKRLEQSLSESPSWMGQNVKGKLNDVYEKSQKGIADITKGATPQSPFQLGEDIKASMGAKVAEELGPSSMLFNEVAETTKNVPVSKKGIAAIQNNIRNLDEVRLFGERGQIKDYIEMLENVKNVDDLKQIGTNLNLDIKDSKGAERRVLNAIKEKIRDAEESNVMRAAEEMKKATGSKLALDEGKDIVSRLKEARAEYAKKMSDFRDVAETGNLGKFEGAGGYLDAINDVQSEKLPQQLFNLKNEQGLRNFEKAFPEAYQTARSGALGDFQSKVSTGDKYSLDKFATNLEKLNPESQSRLFGNELGKAQSVKEIANAFPKNYNPSGTASQSMWNKEFLTSQVTDIPRYAAYKFLTNEPAIKIADQLVKTSSKYAEMATKQPQIFSTFATNLAAQQMQKDEKSKNSSQPLKNKEEILQKTGGSKYAQVMQKAAEKGGHSLAAANYVLSSRDSSYRKLMDEKNDDIQNNK